MNNDTLSPLFLQSVVGPFTIIGKSGSTIPLEIYNPNKTAMLVDQIRFSLRQADPEAIDQEYYVALAIEVLLGSIPLTNKSVTLGALAPRYLGAGAAVMNSDGPAGDGNLVWHLPKPLYVPPLVQLTLHVKRQKSSPEDSGGATVPAINISVVGRSLPADFPVPSEIDVPWVTETQCNVANPDTIGATDSPNRFVSADSDLVNSNNEPLHITQFVGVNYRVSPDARTHTSGPTPADLTVQMSLSNGTMLVRDAIPFFVAFPSDRGILPVSAKLQPGAFVRLELESTVPPGGEEWDGCSFTAVAMHGYRRVQTPGTWG
ncbi:MAG: hypothetical protein WAV09_03370 [Minisyncoccia bacterium]